MESILNPDQKGHFLKGEVRFISQGLMNAKYSLVGNGSIINVHNGIHIRLIEDQFGKFPDKFEIIAPLDAVKVINGEIPDNYIQILPISDYLLLRKIHHGE